MYNEGMPKNFIPKLNNTIKSGVLKNCVATILCLVLSLKIILDIFMSFYLKEPKLDIVSFLLWGFSFVVVVSSVISQLYTKKQIEENFNNIAANLVLIDNEEGKEINELENNEKFLNSALSIIDFNANFSKKLMFFPIAIIDISFIIVIVLNVIPK